MDTWRGEIRDYVVRLVLSEVEQAYRKEKDEHLSEIQALSAWNLENPPQDGVLFSWPEGKHMHLMTCFVCCTEPHYCSPDTISVEPERKASVDGWHQARSLLSRFRLEYSAWCSAYWKFATGFSTLAGLVKMLTAPEITHLHEHLLAEEKECRIRSFRVRNEFAQEHFKNKERRDTAARKI